jgi:CRP-like cAMP-binding protein
LSQIENLKLELESAQAKMEDEVVDDFGDKLIHTMSKLLMGGAKVMAAAEGKAKTQMDFVQKLANLPSKLVGKLKMGNTFGGPGCFEGDECPVTAVAKTDCELHALDPDKMEDVKAQFPEFTEEIGLLGADCKMTELLQKAIDEAMKKREIREEESDEVGALVTHGGQRNLNRGSSSTGSRKVYTSYSEMRPKSRQVTASGAGRANSREPLMFPAEKSSDSFV